MSSFTRLQGLFSSPSHNPQPMPIEAELQEITSPSSQPQQAKPILEQGEIDSLRSALSRESTNELLDNAVKLTPCSHSIQEGPALGLFGTIGEYSGITSKKCPECKENVAAAFIDHKIRNLIQVLAKILDQSNSTLSEKEIKDLRAEITCPVEFDDLLEGVFLIPCAHRVQESVAKTLHGSINKAKCPLCRVETNGYIADPMIRKISQILPQILDKLEAALPKPNSALDPLTRQSSGISSSTSSVPGSESSSPMPRNVPGAIARARNMISTLFGDLRRPREYEHLSTSTSSSAPRSESSSPTSTTSSYASTPTVHMPTWISSILDPVVERGPVAIFSIFSSPTDPIALAMQELSSDREFMKAIKKWAQSTCNRSLNREERNVFQMPDIRMTLGEAEEQLSRAIIAEQDFEVFYRSFKNKMSSLGISLNSDAFFTYYRAIHRHFQDCMELLRDTLRLAKCRTELEKFSKKIFHDILNAFASQPLVDLTIDGYKATVDLIKKYSFLDSADIEMELRTAIKEHHHSDEFSSSISGYTIPGRVASRVPQFVEARERMLRDEKHRLELELSVMRGPNGFDGEINAAYLEKFAAEAVSNQAVNEFNDLRSDLIVGDIVEIMAMQIGPQLTSLIQAQQAVRAAMEAREAPTRRFTTLMTRFEEIAVFNGHGELIDGRLGTIYAELATLEEAARKEIIKIAEFYIELYRPITEYNKAQRFANMHSIIDN